MLQGPGWHLLAYTLPGAGTAAAVGGAQLVLSTVLDALAGSDLCFTTGDMRPRAGITLAPAGPLYLQLNR